MPKGTAAPLVAIVVLATSLGGPAACGSDEGPRQAPDPRIELLVGDILPLTGPAAGLGASAQKAAQLAVAQVNDAIGGADAPHAVEIVHGDAHSGGPAGATRSLLEVGADCIVGPRSRSAMESVIRAASPRRALVISPHARTASLAAANGELVVGLARARAQRAIDPAIESPEPGPGASFARRYGSTDPPIGPARTGDGRQFDATMLCYLAAVAAGSDRASRLAGRLAPPAPEAPRYTWLELEGGIEALQRGEPIVYVGATLRAGVFPQDGVEFPPQAR